MNLNKSNCSFIDELQNIFHHYVKCVPGEVAVDETNLLKPSGIFAVHVLSGPF